MKELEQIESAIQEAKNFLNQGKSPTDQLHFLLNNNRWYLYKGAKHFEEFCLFFLDCPVSALQKMYQHDKKTLSFITQALRIKHQGWDTNRYPIEDFQYRPQGNSKNAALRRLKKHKLDLYKKVINEEMSANAAMIEAGFRKKKISIGIEKEDAVNYLLNNFSVDELIWIYRKVIDKKKSDQ